MMAFQALRQSATCFFCANNKSTYSIDDIKYRKKIVQADLQDMVKKNRITKFNLFFFRIKLKMVNMRKKTNYFHFKSFFSFSSEEINQLFFSQILMPKQSALVCRKCFNNSVNKFPLLIFG
jgi:hypothetical protein